MACTSECENGVTDAWKDQIGTPDNGELFHTEVRNPFPLKLPETWTGVKWFELASGPAVIPRQESSVHPPGCVVLGVEPGDQNLTYIVSQSIWFASLHILVKEG